MAKDLIPIASFDIRAEKRHQAMIFTAAAYEGEGKNDYGYTPEQPLHWWYRFDDRDGWHHIPQDKLVPLDENLRVVQVLADQLEHHEHAGKVRVAVTEATDHPDGNQHTIEFPVAWLPPTVPIRLDGGGEPDRPGHQHVDVSLNRARVANTEDEILWIVIRGCSDAMGFKAYHEFMDDIFSSPRFNRAAGGERKRALEEMGQSIDGFVFNSVDAYRVLRYATELFVMTRCGVIRPETLHPKQYEEEGRFGHRLPEKFERMWECYLEPLGNLEGPPARILPYLDLVRRKLGDIGSVRSSVASVVDRQAAMIQEKLVHPILLELIWSYWMEEGMLVQSFNSIAMRFQNRRSNGERDPLANLEIDPLRPANNLLWGWVQDETNRLSVLRRAHEYGHAYGFTLQGKALSELRIADRRSKFLEAFHNLLWRCAQFYTQDDQTTVIADAFPVLNALKETHYLLAQGAHNQFGDLPSQARQEMMMQQWILARPEVREFLGTRVMVPYPEPWMDRVDSVKTLKGWTDTSVVHFRDLATFGEQILLSVRWGAWSKLNNPAHAANWARYWRAEIQGYLHAYRIATSVDLTAELTDQRQAETRFLAPSVHLRNRLAAQAPTR
jgi:hypothetical protein